MLGDLQDQSAKSNKFVEAELCKQRIEVFKNKEKELLLDELKQNHLNEGNQLDIEKREELDQFNSKWDEDYFALRDKFESMELLLKDNQTKEFNQKKEDLEQAMAMQIPKPSPEAINLNRIIEVMVQQKE